MRAAYRQVAAIDKDKLSPGLKFTAWQRFLAAFPKNNPYTSEDEELRAKARKRATYWQGEKQRVARVEADRRRQAAIRRDSGSRAWRDPVTGMEFVKIPDGSFEMGCHANAGKCDDDEKPARTVRLDGFWMGKTEVTVGQFKRFVNDSGYRTEAEKSKRCWVFDGKWKQKTGANWRTPGFQQGANHPVACVSWNDSNAFALWLSGKTGQSFRLPSEAQWEYACRAGGKSVTYGTGNGRLSSGNANYKNNNRGTTAVGRYQANSLGLKDMSGNVWEWVADKYTGYQNVGTTNPAFNGSGSFRVFRGGSWNNPSRSLRCSDRYSGAPSGGNGGLGFRLLRLR